MASIYQLKSSFQGILRPIVNRLAAKGITANQVTLAAVGLSAFGGLCMALLPQAKWPWLMLPAILFVRMALNAIDGMLAREHNMKSTLGAILNELGDVISDTMLYLPFALIKDVPAWMVVVICLLAVISEMTGVVAVQIGATRRYDGPLGKSDRAFAFGALGLFYGLGYIGIPTLTLVFAALILLLAATICNRAAKALKEAVHD